MQNLKELRMKAGLTQMQLAAACEVSLTSVIKWENGAGKPSDENQQKLDRLFVDRKAVEGGS